MKHNRFVLLVLITLFVMGNMVFAQDEQVTLRVWTSSSSAVENEAKEAQFAAFEEAYPNVTLDVLISPDYGTQIRASFASGDYPDVFTVGQFDFPQWQSDGLLAVGTDQIEEPEGIVEGLRNAFTADGELYCAPKDFSTLALLYNSDLFDEAGIDYPSADWTWDDMTAAARAVTDLEDSDAVGFSAAADRNRWLAFLYANGGEIFDANGNAVIDSDNDVEALSFYQSFVSNGTGALPGDLDSAGWNGEAFGRGLAAMTVEGNWAIGYLSDTFPELNWGAAEIPAGPSGDAKATLTFTECWAVSSRASDATEEAAWNLVNFLTGTGEFGAEFVATAGFGVMPARTDFIGQWLETRGEQYDAFTNGADYAIAPVFPLGFDDFTAELDDATTQVMQLSDTPEDALADVAEVGQEIAEELGTITEDDMEDNMNDNDS